jgi:Cupin
MDAFSEVLSAVKLNGAVFFNAEFSAPWGFSAPTGKAIAAQVAPGASHLVLYHLVIDGAAVVEMLDGASFVLRPETSSSFRTGMLTT